MGVVDEGLKTNVGDGRLRSDENLNWRFSWGELNTGGP